MESSAHSRYPRHDSHVRPSGSWLLVLLVLFAVLWFLSLGTRALVSPDEGRYATIALNMLHSGDWVTPRLNGLLYFEKPALGYWMGALSLRLLGINEFAARLWPGLAGFLTVLTVGLTGARLWGRESGIRAFAIAGATSAIALGAHYLTLDTGLMFFLTLTLCAVLIANGVAHASAARRRNWIWLAWAAIAGAVLTKGLIGLVIPGATLVLASLWRRDVSLWRGMHWVSGLLIFFVLAAPWFVWVSLRNPVFAHFFFIHEHFERYLTTVHNRNEVWWYFLPLLLAGLLPWTSALPWLWRAPAQPSGVSGVSGAPGAPRRAGTRELLIVWLVFIFAFFSLSDSKLPSYILPMFPALALLIVMRLRDVKAATLRWHLLLTALLWALALVVSFGVDRLARPAAPIENLQPIAEAVRWGALVFFAGAALAAWFLRGSMERVAERRVTAAVITVAAAHFIAITLLMQSHNSFGQLKSAKAIASKLAPLVTPQTPVFSVRAYDQTLPFYLRRNVTLVDYEDEFALGEVQEPTRWILQLDTFIAQWTAAPQAAAYLSYPAWAELHQRGVQGRVVYQDPRRLVMVKP
ncbi:MAG: glycosyltransferase family 39 protein [Burkholderiaceae bacterium]|jgi:4-amino-4-deoxy-L-arabinose transferase-like glycosyltransferase|nr:glycosyltransferase family 39 protein [Burkholderiaceae bacterium]